MSDFENEIVLDLPSITNIKFKNINKSYFKVILVNFFLVLILLFTGLVLLHKLVFTDNIKEYIIIIYSSFFFLFLLLFIYLKSSFPKRMYALRQKDISYKSGLFFRKLTTVPFSRIQHVELDEGPISRLFNLSSISVYTAGDSSDDLEIKGISKDIALQLKEFISVKLGS